MRQRRVAAARTTAAERSPGVLASATVAPLILQVLSHSQNIVEIIIPFAEDNLALSEPSRRSLAMVVAGVG